MIRPSLAPGYRPHDFPVPRAPAAEPAPPASPPRPARGHRQTAARRVLLSSLAAYAVATFALAVALELRLPTARYPEHGQRVEALRRLQAEHPDRPLVVAVGSSRTQMGLDVAAMGFAEEPGAPLVYNYGLVGALPVHHPLAYRRLRAAGVRPAAVVCEIFPAALGVGDAAGTFYADSGAGLTADELARLAPDMRSPRVALAWAKSRAGAWAWFRQEFHRQLVPDWRDPVAARKYAQMWEPDDRGFRSSGESVSDADRERATDKALGTYMYLCRNLRPDPAAVRAHRELVAACRADGVPIAFYLTPEGPLFHSCYTPTARAAVAGFVRLLTDDLGAPVFDLWGGWADGDFMDGHHLLRPGAAKFGRRFADDHLRPWLAALPKPK